MVSSCLSDGNQCSLGHLLSVVATTTQCEIEHARARLLAWSFVLVLKQEVRTAFLPFVGRNNGGLMEVCDFKIGFVHGVGVLPSPGPKVCTHLLLLLPLDFARLSDAGIS